jgi:hypothetical protein
MMDKLITLLDSILLLSDTPYHRATWFYGDQHPEAKQAFLDWAASHSDVVAIRWNARGDAFDVERRDNFNTIATWYRSYAEIDARGAA